MIRTRLAVLAIVAGILVGSSAVVADTWNGLTVDTAVQYPMPLPAEYGSGSGSIEQFSGGIDIAVNGGVGYSLPWISVVGATTNPFWGVCIDTREWSVKGGTTLKKGWDPANGIPVSNVSRFNGTVYDSAAWNHTTYLFNQFGGTIGAMSDVQKAAFQLATWEVMSGDGTAAGGNWLTGNFRATNVSGTLLWEADNYVKAAYVGSENWSDAQADKAYYLHDGQDFLVYAPSPPIVNNSVPEPMSLMLGIMGLGSVAGLKRLRRK
jgi:hypothetical protein